MGNRIYQLHPAPIYPKQINYPYDELSHYLLHLKLKESGHEKKKSDFSFVLSTEEKTKSTSVLIPVPSTQKLPHFQQHQPHCWQFLTGLKPGGFHRELKAKPTPPETQTLLIQCLNPCREQPKNHEASADSTEELKRMVGDNESCGILTPIIPSYLHSAGCLRCRCRS